MTSGISSYGLWLLPVHVSVNCSISKRSMYNVGHLDLYSKGGKDTSFVHSEEFAYRSYKMAQRKRFYFWLYIPKPIWGSVLRLAV